MSISRLQQVGRQLGPDVTGFLQKLVRTPSPSGQEGEVAVLIADEMRRLAYDEVFTDPMGNVVGIVRGTGGGDNILLNGHMDQVPPGRLEAWPYPPYAGVIAGGHLYGRGASDMKGGIAAQVYAAALVKRVGLPHRGDIIVSCVVLEEPAECVGTAYLCDTTLPQRGVKVDFVVLAEPSGLKLVLGHRGRVELEVTTVGRTSHGSAPWRGINAVYRMLPVIARVQELNASLPEHPLLGKSVVSLTNVSCSPGQLSVIPDLCTVNLDRRLAPGETPEGAVAQIESILGELRQDASTFQGSVRVREVEETSYTGLKRLGRKMMSPWLIPPEHPGVVKAFAALAELGHPPEYGYWSFATDGSHTSAVLGIPTIGFGPGDEAVAHTPEERISLDALAESVPETAAIALAITE